MIIGMFFAGISLPLSMASWTMEPSEKDISAVTADMVNLFDLTTK